jgi:hypothetical protein
MNLSSPPFGKGLGEGRSHGDEKTRPPRGLSPRGFFHIGFARLRDDDNARSLIWLSARDRA